MDAQTKPSQADLLDRKYHVCFSVGGVRGAFHLGAVHALIMSRAPAPGLIVGSSVGAAHGAMLAHLLRDNNDDDDALQTLAALRRYVDLVLHVPNFMLLGAPDLRDVLPYGNKRNDSEEKRHHDKQGANAETGSGSAGRQNLKALLNAILRQRVSMRQWGRIAKHWVGWTNRRRRWYHGPALVGSILAVVGTIRPLDHWRFWPAFFVKNPEKKFWDKAVYALLRYYRLEEGLLPANEIRELLKEAIRQPDDPDGENLVLGALANEAGVELLVCAADLHTARLRVLPPHSVKAIDALMAAMAVPGIWPPVREQSLYLNGTAGKGEPCGPFVDAVRVSVFPIRQLLHRLKHLSAHVALSSGTADHRVITERVHTVLAVGAIPAEDGPRDLAYDNMVDVVERSVALQAYAETSLDMKLARVVSDTVCEGDMKPGWERRTREVLANAGGTEDLGPGWNPDRSGPTDPVEDLSLRLDLEHIQPAQPARFEHITKATPAELATMAAEGCRTTLSALLRKKIIKAPKPTAGPLTCQRLLKVQGERALGLNVDTPGLPEICRSCTGVIEQEAPKKKPDAAPDTERLKRWMAWPVKTGSAPETKPDRRPVVAMTLAGGVFKGVFQLGVVHALEALKVQPRILAGASVGTLVAAQAARVFCEQDAERRQGLLQRTAHMYATQDTWVPTRSWTHFAHDLMRRLQETDLRFSDINATFRNYHKPRNPLRSTLLTAQGFQRLGFVWPSEQLRLWDAAYAEDLGGFWRQLRAQIVRGLHGYEVPLEVLGADRILGKAWELGLGLGDRDQAAEQPFITYDNVLDNGGIRLMATTTDLSDGTIRLLGFEERFSNPALMPAVFASSAFPGLFRPRRESEVFPKTGSPDRLFSDGGIFNNNPLNEITRFLRHASKMDEGRWLHETDAPHLIIAASLETEANHDDDRPAWNVKTIVERTGAVAYNYKLDRFKGMQQRLTKLVEACDKPPRHAPLRVRVKSIYPKWLVPTFGATPPMGFKRDLQVQSIAHGCKQAMGSFDEQVAPYGLQVTPLENPKPDRSGLCPWYTRPDGSRIQCIFAAQTTEQEPVQQTGRDIYKACGDPQTHEGGERGLL